MAMVIRLVIDNMLASYLNLAQPVKRSTTQFMGLKVNMWRQQGQKS
jgi:hypothetical protein